MSEAAARLAPSIVRDTLLTGPAGGDLVGEAVVALLDRSGLLAHREFVFWCVDLDDDDPVAWADLDLTVLRACARGDIALDISGPQRLLLALVVTLIDLSGLLRALDGSPLTWAVAAILALIDPALQRLDPPPDDVAARILDRGSDPDFDLDEVAGPVAGRCPPPRPAPRATTPASPHGPSPSPRAPGGRRPGKEARRRQLRAAAAALALQRVRR